MAGASLALAGCPTTTTTTTINPITGIIVRSSSLLTGHACGTGTGQVYRYAAVLYYVSDSETAPDSGVPQLPSTSVAFASSNIVDCFTDATFENLPSQSGTGSLDFNVFIFAYDQAAYVAAGLPDGLQCATSGSCAAQVPPSSTQETQATWVTTCNATQQSGIPVLAACQPLQPGASAAVVDGGTSDDGEAPVDAAATDSAADTGAQDGGVDTGAPEAGADANDGAIDADAAANGDASTDADADSSTDASSE